ATSEHGSRTMAMKLEVDGPDQVRGGAAGPDGRASSGWRAAPLLPAIVETLGSYRRRGDELIEDLPNLDPARARDVFSSLAGQQGSCVGLDAALLHGLLVFPDGDGRAVAVRGFHVIDGQDAGLADEGRFESPAGVVFLSPLLLPRQSLEVTEPCDHVQASNLVRLSVRIVRAPVYTV